MYGESASGGTGEERNVHEAGETRRMRNLKTTVKLRGKGNGGMPKKASRQSAAQNDSITICNDQPLMRKEKGRIVDSWRAKMPRSGTRLPRPKGEKAGNLVSQRSGGKK